jgi:hypothetical protein
MLVAPPVPVVPPVITTIISSFVPSRLSRGGRWRRRRRDILATRLGFVLPIALDTPVEELNVRCGGSSIVRRRSRGGRRSFFRKSKTTLVRKRHLEMVVSIRILALATEPGRTLTSLVPLRARVAGRHMMDSNTSQSMSTRDLSVVLSVCF